MPDAFDPPPQPGPAAAPESSGLPPNVAAGIASIFTLVGGLVFLVLEKRSAFVRFYAMQSVYLGGAALLASVAFRVIGFVLHSMPVIGGILRIFLMLLECAFWLAWLAAYLVQIVKAFAGAEWEIPFLGPLARRQLAVRRP